MFLTLAANIHTHTHTQNFQDYLMMMPEQELEVLPGYNQDSLEVLRLLTSAGFTVSSVGCRRPTERKTNDGSQKAECTQQRCFH